MTTTNYPDGVTNVLDGANMGSFHAPDPTKTWMFFDDFTAFWGSATGPADWLVTNTNTTVGGAVITDAGKGILLVTNLAGIADAYRAQWQGGNTSDVAEIFAHVATKEAWFKTRFAINTEVLQSDLVIGAYVVDADPVTAFTDGIAFRKADGSALLNLQIIAASVVTTVPVTTLVANTFVDVGWYYDGAGKFDIFVDDVRVASALSTTMPTTELAPSFTFQNGEAVAKVMRLDYIMMAQAR